MMKYIRLIIPCIVLASVFVACSSADKRLEYALSFAGDNRGELERFWNIMDRNLKSWKQHVSSSEICLIGMLTKGGSWILFVKCLH